MEQLLLGLLLEDGGRGLARLLGAIAVFIIALLLMAVVIPVMLLAGGPARAAPAAPPNEGFARAANRPVAAGEGPVEVARHYLGVPYVFGGANPAIGLDCSGLVQLVFHQLGINLPHNAQLQYDATTRLEREQLQPGDLVFFARTYTDPRDWITHVGIYVGDGLQIDAPTDGQAVSIQPVFSGFWGAHFVAGGRVRRS